MGYRIPDEQQLADAIEEALQRQPLVESQRQLGDNVRSVLHEEDTDLRASDTRIRRIALDRGLAEVRVRTGTTDEQVRQACPVCGAELEHVANMTLGGGTTVVGADCPECPYGTGARHEVPLRYEFVRADDGPGEKKGPF